VQRAVLVLYDEVDPDGYRKKNDALLETFMRQIAKEYVPLQHKATALLETSLGIFEQMMEASTHLGRPIDVLLDASTCQRYHILAVLANGFRSGILRRISVFYAEGDYPAGEVGLEVVFGEGVWKSIPVPGMEGEYRPDKSLLYCVSVGFEGHKTLRVVARADPDRVVLVFPKPGITAEYEQRTRIANKALIEQYAIPESSIISAHAGDAVGAWAAMAEASVENWPEENCVYLLNGTKPHSLAMGLRAVTTHSPAVLYSVPEAYRVVNIPARGVFWRYDVENLAIPG
jgi:hypothetical protein